MNNDPHSTMSLDACREIIEGWREENTKLIEENKALKLHIKKLNDTFKVYREHHADTIRALKRQISHYESSLAQLSLLADTYRKSK
jgi:regulator of replication initiation timing